MMVCKVAFEIVNHGQRVVSLQGELWKAPSYIWEDSGYRGIGHCSNQILQARRHSNINGHSHWHKIS